MNRRDLRLIPLAAGAWAMSLLCVYLPGTAGPGAVVAVVLGGSALLWARFRSRDPDDRIAGGYGSLPRNRMALPAVLLFAGAAVAVTAMFAGPSRAEAAELDGKTVEVVAEITSSSAVGSDGRLWFDAQTIRAGPGNATAELSVPVRIGIEALPGGGTDLGARIRVRGQAQATDAGERAALVLFGTSASVERPAEGLFAVAAQARHDFVARAVRLPEPGAGLLPGLAVGDTTAVSAELNGAMLTSGLSHLTAVSGANCAIVVGAVFWLVAVCGGGRMLRAVLSLLALAAFVILVTPEPSVIRAATMAGLAMLTLLCGKPSAGTSVLCLAVTTILVADPWLAATSGFALSAAATGALILLAPPLSRGLSRWMPPSLALAVAVPTSAQLVCGPIIALFSEQQSVVGIVANLLAAPAAPLATVLGMLACLSAPVPFLADLFVAAAWLPAAWIATTATTSVTLPFAAAKLVPGLPAALLVLVLSASVTILLARSSMGRPPSAPWRVIAAALLVVAVALGGARTLLTGPFATATVPEDWSIAACDVGQGDALLLRSGDSVALIDTGPEAERLDVCLRGLGIGEIDLLVLTHFDMDHIGGTAAVVGRARTVLHGPIDETADTEILEELRAGGSEVIQASAGLRGTLGGAQWRVLWPRRDSAAFPAGNDASVTIDVSGGGMPSALFLGDLSATPQQLLTASGTLRTHYDIVKVAHHGSADQDPGLYGAVRPAVALFSVGVDNDYGHPRQETLDLATASGAVPLRTDRQGRILLALRDGEIAVWTERNDEERDEGPG